MLKLPEFKQSRETQIIYDLFREIGTRQDRLITYSELREATGLSKEKLRGPIHTAIRRALNHDGLVIECDRGIAYRLSGDEETATASVPRAIERARRIHRVGLKKANCVDRSKLTSESRIALDVEK